MRDLERDDERTAATVDRDAPGDRCSSSNADVANSTRPPTSDRSRPRAPPRGAASRSSWGVSARAAPASSSVGPRCRCRSTRGRGSLRRMCSASTADASPRATTSPRSTHQRRRRPGRSRTYRPPSRSGHRGRTAPRPRATRSAAPGCVDVGGEVVGRLADEVPVGDVEERGPESRRARRTLGRGRDRGVDDGSDHERDQRGGQDPPDPAGVEPAKPTSRPPR